MLVSAAVCPHPPALVPTVSQGDAGTLDELRSACVTGVRRLFAADPDVVVCVGAGEESREWGPDGGGNMQAYGVDASFGGAEPGLPLSLTLATYLLEAAGPLSCNGFLAIAHDASPEACRASGEELAGLGERVSLLVMGDASAKRALISPGYLDERAMAFDTRVLDALRRVDPDALLALDPALADDLWVAGRPAWQTLAGALLTSSRIWSAQLEYAAAPLGVGYFVVNLESS